MQENPEYWNSGTHASNLKCDDGRQETMDEGKKAKDATGTTTASATVATLTDADAAVGTTSLVEVEKSGSKSSGPSALVLSQSLKQVQLEQKATSEQLARIITMLQTKSKVGRKKYSEAYRQYLTKEVIAVAHMPVRNAFLLVVGLLAVFPLFVL